jgi:glycosyltransferase involved in cell wall biosynthesis
MTTKVILDLNSNRRPLTGIGWYARMLTLALREHADDIEALILNGRSISQQLPEIVMPKSQGAVQLVASKLGLPVSLPRIDIPILSDWAYARRTERQKRLLKSYPRHLFHGTNYETPGHNGKKVATFHDLTVLTHPEFHPEVRVKRTRIMLERGARECDAIITVSEHSRREIIEQLSVEQDRVFVTPLAARPGFKPRSSAETEESRARYGLRYGGYILFCGTLEPRKNLLTLLRAYELLPLSVRKRWPLVVAGGLGWKSADIERALSAACNSGQVIVTGYIDDPTLCNLFSAAAVFVLPSITEGFGLPVIEAMASGVPVLCSNTGSLPEVAGEQSACFAPHDAPRLSCSIQELLEDPSKHALAAAYSVQRANLFSWKDCALTTLQCYKAVLNKSGAA